MFHIGQLIHFNSVNQLVTQSINQPVSHFVHPLYQDVSIEHVNNVHGASLVMW